MGCGEGEGDRNKDRGKQIEGASEGVGGNRKEGDHSEGKEDRKIIRDGCAFAHERERGRERKRGGEAAGDRRGLSPFLHPRLRAPLPISKASAPMTELLRLAVPAKGWIPTEYTDERARSLGSRLACSSLSYSFQLQGACIPAGQGPVVCSTLMQQGRHGEDTLMRHYLHIIWSWKHLQLEREGKRAGSLC